MSNYLSSLAGLTLEVLSLHHHMGLYIEPALVTWDGTSIPILISNKGQDNIHLPYVDLEVCVNSITTDED